MNLSDYVQIGDNLAIVTDYLNPYSKSYVKAPQFSELYVKKELSSSSLCHL